MSIHTDPLITLYYGCDARITLRGMPEQSVQTCITSPPYFGLRDYGHPGQIGLEPTPEDYVAELVNVFREVWRVLRDDGTLWLNLGDTYASQPSWGRGGGSTLDGRKQGLEGGFSSDRSVWGLKPKDLVGIPWRVAFALQADGWYLRQDIIWHKPNPMPESVRDRCTRAHEYIFLLSKSARYCYDADAVKEPAKYGEHHTKYSGTYTRHKVEAMQVEGAINGENYQRGMQRAMKNPLQKNKRSVWTVTPQPYKGAHFATFPPALIEPCVLAGSMPGDTILDPFSGSGTTGAVAAAHGRNYIGCEINTDYLPLAHKRIAIEPRSIPTDNLTFTPRVVNQKHDQYTVYIGRSGRGASSIFGNPVIRGDLCPVCGGIHETRGATLPCFEIYARDRLAVDTEYREAILALTGQVLGCFCKPGPCHGDVLIKLWGELMQPKVSHTTLFPPTQAADPVVRRVLEHYELRLQAAPLWLGDFSLKAWSTADAPAPLKNLANRMVTKARDCVWPLPRQTEILGGYNTLYLQRYFEGQAVKAHKDPKNNRHSALLLCLGDFDPPEHQFDGVSYFFPSGTLLHFPAWLDTPGQPPLSSPTHSVGPLPRGERWSLILTYNV